MAPRTAPLSHLLLLTLSSMMAGRELPLPAPHSNCKAIPGTASWPSKASWSRFNESVEGRLLLPTPPGCELHKRMLLTKGGGGSLTRRQSCLPSRIASLQHYAMYLSQRNRMSSLPCTTCHPGLLCLSCPTVVDLRVSCRQPSLSRLEPMGQRYLSSLVRL